MKRIFILAVLLLLPGLAMADWQISGKIIGADGKIPVFAHVHLINFQGDYSQPFQTVSLEKNGQFKLQFSDPGLYRLFITAASHNYCSIPLIVHNNTKDIHVNIQLASLDYRDQFDEIQIIGDWNNFGFNNAEKMLKQADGTFVYERDVQADTICYQLIGLTEAVRSVNGTQSDYFIYDGGGDYRSVLKVKPGTVKIVFDPGKLVRAQSQNLPKVVIETQNGVLQDLWEIDRLVAEEREAFQAEVVSYRQSHQDMKDFKYDWSELISVLKNKIANEPEIEVRQFAAIQLGQLILYRAEIDPTVQSQILELIPPTSAMWATSPRLPMMIRQEETKYQDFIQALSDQNPDRLVRAIALSHLTMMAQHKNDDAAFKNFYEKLKTEYGDVREIQFDLKQLDPEKRIAVGKPVPDFEVVLLDGKEKISNKTLSGKFYLLDFWAVWCGPCVAEMENLHAAYEKFKDKNFIILSLSLDRKIEDITRFRAERWKMPWLHAFLYEEANKPVIQAFEVMAIPKPILVGFDGRIIATEVSLRGDQLEKTLSDFLK